MNARPVFRYLLFVLTATCWPCGISNLFAASANAAQFWQQVALHRERQTGLPSQNVLDVIQMDGQLWAQTDQGWAMWDGEVWQRNNAPNLPSPPQLPPNVTANQVSHSQDGHQWVAATARGLYEHTQQDNWQKLRIADGQGRLWADHDVRGACYDHDGQLWFATLAGVGVRRAADRWQFYTGRDGLPYNDFTCVTTDKDGRLWFGTHLGAVCYDGQRWSYCQGLRWLPDDDVRSIVVDNDNTVWFATAGGVGCLAQRPMTLQAKADFFEEEIGRWIKRTEFGYVSTSRLSHAGDKSTAIPIDSDNDGLWTAMYGASQCFAYAVQRSEESRAAAAGAFEALRFLQSVTQGTDHSPPAGYVARTILPTSRPDPNTGRLAHDQRFRETRDRLWKVYEPRWPKSADGHWYWKSDTSSDELDGHYFLYALYYDLVADSSEEKSRVREVVRQLTDHLIAHDFVLQDHDGQPTRWGVYRPDALNHDIRWIDERGLNSLSMLSYLAVARHVTGDARYEKVAAGLREQHAYAANLMVAKAQRGIGSGNQSDDEMAFMSLYNLVRYTDDSELKERYLRAFHRYWLLVQPERNPFFHFAYAAVGQGVSFADAYGSISLSPSGSWREDSIQALQRFPLDRVNWGHQNRHRLDIVPLPPQQGRDLHDLDDARQAARGYRVDGKVLPIDERFFHHWNTDPWQLDYPGNGRTLAPGTVFLLPYYLGKYHGLLEG